jgi:hypothetical protein
MSCRFFKRAFQAPCPFSLPVKWQDKIETPRRGVREGLSGGEELLVICDWLLGKRMKKRLLRCGWIILLQAVLGAAATFFNDYFRKIGSTANQREWTRIRKIVDRKKAGTFVPKGPRE